MIPPLNIEPNMLLNTLPEAFGESPEVYVEKTDGTWSKKVLGEGLGDLVLAID